MVAISSKIGLCHHCGDECQMDYLSFDDYKFCCQSCATVYQILHQNGMTDYYALNAYPGKKKGKSADYAYLEETAIIDQLVMKSGDGSYVIILTLPQIHCVSCVWLLEHLHLIQTGINKVKVNFMKQTASLSFDSEAVSLRQLAELLDKIGYPPDFKLDTKSSANSKKSVDNRARYQLAVAGFSFGNIMLLSFPEYLGFKGATQVFWLGYINIVLALPILLYAGVDYLKSAWQSIKMRQLNLDVPIALGMLTLFLRSTYEILLMGGEGYLDSLAGFVFFLLIGKWFQKATYENINFDRSYTSYFPISTLKLINGYWTAVPLDEVKKEDIVLIKNEEIIPGDGILLSGDASIDYSFVNGESEPILVKKGQPVYAGGRQIGSSITVTITKKLDQSSLVQLWEDDIFKQPKQALKGVISSASKYFTGNVLAISAITLVYWLLVNPNLAFETFTAVLIVACPCALALAVPFTYGNVLRILSNQGLYLKNVETIERMQAIDHVVFDKTGTLTDTQSVEITFHGETLLNDSQKQLISSVCLHSAHPLSRALHQYLYQLNDLTVTSFSESVGEGIQGVINNNTVHIGSERAVIGTHNTLLGAGSKVCIALNGEYIGYYAITMKFRLYVKEIIAYYQTKNIAVTVLTGDNTKDVYRLKQELGNDIHIVCNQSPKDKLNYIKNLQEQQAHVLMIGDGLNDAGALKQSDVGIVIADKNNNFSPSCDGIIDAKAFGKFDRLFAFIRLSKGLIYGALALAVAYNFTGLYFAVTAQLEPIIAAIIMPLSSISVIVYGLIASRLCSLYKLESGKVIT